MLETVLNNYVHENHAVRLNLYRILTHGKLGGTGKLMILPVDQGFEHGPDRSFASNPKAFDPNYFFQLATAGGFSAYAAPLGLLEAGIDRFIGSIPMILKLNSSNLLYPNNLSPNQALTASVQDAVRLGCVAVGLTIYPGSAQSLSMIENAKEIIKEAKSLGLATVVWSYPRGENLSKEAETSLDIINYAAHIAALLGANIIKVKLPTARIEQKEVQKVYDKHNINIATLADRVRIVKRSCFDGKRIVLFSGGDAKSDEDIINEISEINRGGGNGSIVGRNMFQRNFDDAIALANRIVMSYKATIRSGEVS